MDCDTGKKQWTVEEEGPYLLRRSKKGLDHIEYFSFIAEDYDGRRGRGNGDRRTPGSGKEWTCRRLMKT